MNEHGIALRDQTRHIRAHCAEIQQQMYSKHEDCPPISVQSLEFVRLC